MSQEVVRQEQAKERQKAQASRGGEGGRGRRKKKEETLRDPGPQGFGDSRDIAGEAVGELPSTRRTSSHQSITKGTNVFTTTQPTMHTGDRTATNLGTNAALRQA
jgi:hypothetical protein